MGSEIEIVHSELWLASAEELTAELLQQRWFSEHQFKLQLVGQSPLQSTFSPAKAACRSIAGNGEARTGRSRSEACVTGSWSAAFHAVLRCTRWH